jgi:peptide/nickel transport system permease protein
MKWYVIRRLLWTVFAVYLLLSASFFAIALTPDPNKWMAGFSGGEDAVEAYEERRNLDRPLLDRYVDWVTGYTTLDWGHSFRYDKPVLSVVTNRIPVTLGYLVPAVLLATLASVVAGVYSALRRDSWIDRVTSGLSSLGLAVPAFILAFVVAAVGNPPPYDPSRELFAGQNLTALAHPAFVLGMNLFAVQSWAVRAEAIEIVPAEFVKTLRANGAGRGRIARHVARNAAAPVFALVVSEVFVLLIVSTYVVELVFQLPGFAAASFAGFYDRDYGLILAAVVLPTLFALLVNLLKDVVTAYVDPRVGL